MSDSQPSSCSVLRQFTVGKAPITPLRQAATTRSTPDTRNIGAAISGNFNRLRKRASGLSFPKAVVPLRSEVVAWFRKSGTFEGPIQSALYLVSPETRDSGTNTTGAF